MDAECKIYLTEYNICLLKSFVINTSCERAPVMRVLQDNSKSHITGCTECHFKQYSDLESIQKAAWRACSSAKGVESVTFQMLVDANFYHWLCWLGPIEDQQHLEGHRLHTLQ